MLNEGKKRKNPPPKRIPRSVLFTFQEKFRVSRYDDLNWDVDIRRTSSADQGEESSPGWTNFGHYTCLENAVVVICELASTRRNREQSLLGYIETYRAVANELKETVRAIHRAKPKENSA